MKKKLFAMAALVLLLAGAVAGTVAYFTANKQTHNVITTGNIEIDLVETMLEDGKEVTYPEKPVPGLMPGVTTSKIVRVHNVGPNPAWVRVRVDVQIDGRKVDVSAADSPLAIDFDTTKWEKHGGYYYYIEKLEPKPGLTGDWYTVTPLFTAVKLLETVDNAYQNAEIEISVTAEGIQSQNNELAAGESITSVWPAGIRILDFVR